MYGVATKQTRFTKHSKVCTNIANPRILFPVAKVIRYVIYNKLWGYQ